MKRWRHVSAGRGCFGARGHSLRFDAAGFLPAEVPAEVLPVLGGSADWTLEDDGIPSAEEIAALEAEAVALGAPPAPTPASAPTPEPDTKNEPAPEPVKRQKKKG